MPPQSIDQSAIFRTYAFVALGVLLVAGLVLTILSGVLRRDVKKVWATYRSWLIMVPLAFGVIYLGRIPTILFFVVLALVGFKEFARATGLYRDWWMTGAAYLAILGTGLTAIVRDPTTGSPGWYGLFMALPVYAISLILMVPILRNRTQGQLQTMALAILGFTYIGWMFLHLAMLAGGVNAIGYLLYLLVAVEISDVAAFTFGKLLGRGGRHPLRSQVSPKKTWEGSLGALAISMILPWAMHFSFPHFGTTQLILTGLIVGVGGQLGDLGISVIKRDIGIKDMGALIPGHGGVLDRIDSLIFTAPLFLHMVDFYYRHW